MTAGAEVAGAIPLVVALAKRERTRAILRAAVPRRRGRLVLVRGVEELVAALRSSLVDAAIVDLAGSPEESWRVTMLAPEYPATAFFGATPMRAGDAQAVADCAEHGFAGVLVEGVDDAAVRAMLLRASFSSRFVQALGEAPGMLGLTSPVQRRVWRLIVEHAGRPVRTAAIAAEVGVTREHLSRSFAAAGAPNLKRAIDLVRMLAAAELAKSPGLDLRDVAAMLGFASASHLSTTSMRIVGAKPVSLTRLRSADILERFVRGHERSRR